LPVTIGKKLQGFKLIHIGVAFLRFGGDIDLFIQTVANYLPVGDSTNPRRTTPWAK
jgi:hypothetical protein